MNRRAWGSRESSSFGVAALSSSRGQWRDADRDLGRAGPGSPMGANQGTATPSAGQGEGGGSLSGPHMELSLLHILPVLFPAVFSVLSVWHRVAAH